MLSKLEPAYWRLQGADALLRQILDGKQAQQFLLKTQELEVQKVEQRGQPQVGEINEAIDERASESTGSSTEEASSLNNSQPAEVKPTAPDTAFSSQTSLEGSPTNTARKSPAQKSPLRDIMINAILKTLIDCKTN